MNALKWNDIVAVSACRTAMGKFGGSLKDIPAYDLGAIVVKEAIKRAGITSNEVDDVILGSCRQAGNGPNPARTASVKAGIPEHVPAITLNMACPSAMRAIAMASLSLLTGQAKFVVAGGFDSMSSIPYLLKNARWKGFKMGNKILEDGWSDSIDPLIGQGMGETAENLNDKYKISRKEQDEFAASSHQKAARAQKNGWFDNEIVPVKVPSGGKEPSFIFDKDETIRYEIDPVKMASLPPVFRKNGTVTAANSCGLSDGAVALVLTTRSIAHAEGLHPLFSIVNYHQTAVSPLTMGEGPARAIPAVLQKAKMTLQDMDILEINEAFAVQVLANVKELNLDMNKLNVHGGAIALGHPTGISGARIVVTGFYALQRLNKEFCVAAICGGGGVTSAMIIRRES